jgi:CRISPR/Cas system CSM-associated protein Csm3 (group 7 of RAMP superfamily)
VSAYHITAEKFINPYNFVSIDEEVRRESVGCGALSGSIRCELETLTPLFIPNTSKDAAFGSTFSHSYDFFSREDLHERDDYEQNPAQPIIPGSSIRGAIRSAFEAVTNSCLCTCDDDNTLYRRTPVPRKTFGIIEKDPSTGARVLYKASKGKWDARKRGIHQTGDTLCGGIYLRGEDFPFGATKKKNDAVMKYDLDENGGKIELLRFSEDSREWTNLVEVWRLYQHRDSKIKGVNQTPRHAGYPGYLTAEAIPVYCAKLDDGDFYYLAPAAITKEVFSRTLNELLKKQGGHNPCTRAQSLCPACRLFGMVGEEAQASRLMFRDACPAAFEGAADWRGWYEPVRALPILSSPKVSATEFYMEDVAGAAYFNYDYTVNYFDGFDQSGARVKSPVRSFLDNPKLRGRKFYWHRKSVLLDSTKVGANQRTEIRPVGAGKSFFFEIAFDRITPDELETLLWVLTFGEHNATHAHKLGHAKPYGYGSVRVTKAVVSVVTLGEDLRLKKEISSNYVPKAPSPSEALREYLKLTDFSQASDDVKYPTGDKGGASTRSVYQWFGINKEIRLGGFFPSFNYVLPKPLDLPVHLPGYAPGHEEKEDPRARKITWAAAPEAQSDIPMPQKASSKGVTTLGTVRNLQKSQKAAAAVRPYGTYWAAELRRWLIPHNNNPRDLRDLRSFVEDFERAEREGDSRYRSLAHFYKPAKEKVENG